MNEKADATKTAGQVEASGDSDLRASAGYLPKVVDDAIRGLAAGESAEQAALTLAAMANRAVAELNKLARAEANRRRGQPEWGAWAGLANAARDAVLRVSTCRKMAAELMQRVHQQG